MFQEGHDDVAEQAFREIARLTGGAWCRFDPGAAAQLRELLRAAAAYAAGGREALLRLSRTGSGAAQLLGQMKWSPWAGIGSPGSCSFRCAIQFGSHGADRHRSRTIDQRRGLRSQRPLTRLLFAANATILPGCPR